MPTGSAAIANGSGIRATFDTGNVTIGGTFPQSRNVISGNSGDGIFIGAGFPSGVNGFLIQGNNIGTDRTGQFALPNGGNGITNNQGANTIGGSASGAGNIIAANLGAGIATGNGATILSNGIGINTNGEPLGNRNVGIAVFGPGVVIGGIASGEANLIAYNGAAVANGGGVNVDGGVRTGVRIRGNSIWANTSDGTLPNRGLAIDLNNDGPTANDPGDADGGDNGSQNFPLIISAVPNGSGGTHVTGVLDSQPGSYDIDFYTDPGCVSRTHDFFEAFVYIGSTTVVADGGGHAAFDFDLSVPIADGDPVTATATDSNGNTSELSPRLPWTISPASGDAAGGTAVTITGTSFSAGAAVQIGGQPAGSIVVVSPGEITATSPALAPGTAWDVEVVNADLTHGTLVKGFVTNFLDVPDSHQFYAFVTSLVSNAITAGVGGGLYGVDQSTLRQQMAVFLLKARYGLCFTPPPCKVETFTDVPCSSGFAPWIYELVAEGVTGGCGNGSTYCPAEPVKRQQMAVLLLRMFEGAGYTPPACVTATFGDMPCDSPFAPWVYELVARGITGGCGGGNYCGADPATRGQMAVFITKTFHLQ